MADQLSRTVTLAGKSADAVVAAAQTHQATVKGAITSALGAAAGDAAVVLLSAGATALTNAKQKLYSADAAHAVELADDLPVRQERDAAAAAVRSEIVKLRPTLEAAAPPQYTTAIGLTGVTPDDPALLQRFGALVAAGLKREPVPASNLEGYTIPAAAVATRLEQGATRLESALSAVARETKENQESLRHRDQVLADFTTVFRAVANVTSVLLVAGGEAELAARVRPSARRPSQTEEVAASPEAAGGDA